MEKEIPKYLTYTLQFLFPRSEKHRKIALTILLEIRNRQHTSNKYNSAEYHDFCKKHGIKEYSYQTVLSKLREPIEDIEGFSLVLKKGGHHEGEFTISTDFWDSLVKELHEFLASGK